MYDLIRELIFNNCGGGAMISDGAITTGVSVIGAPIIGAILAIILSPKNTDKLIAVLDKTKVSFAIDALGTGISMYLIKIFGSWGQKIEDMLQISIPKLVNWAWKKLCVGMDKDDK